MNKNMYNHDAQPYLDQNLRPTSRQKHGKLVIKLTG